MLKYSAVANLVVQFYFCFSILFFRVANALLNPYSLGATPNTIVKIDSLMSWAGTFAIIWFFSLIFLKYKSSGGWQQILGVLALVAGALIVVSASLRIVRQLLADSLQGNELWTGVMDVSTVLGFIISFALIAFFGFLWMKLKSGPKRLLDLKMASGAYAVAVILGIVWSGAYLLTRDYWLYNEKHHLLNLFSGSTALLNSLAAVYFFGSILRSLRRENE